MKNLITIIISLLFFSIAFVEAREVIINLPDNIYEYVSTDTNSTVEDYIKDILRNKVKYGLMDTKRKEIEGRKKVDYDNYDNETETYEREVEENY